MLACLRIAGVVTFAVARLATDPPGSALVGRVSHPLDDRLNFMTIPLHHSFQTSIAWSQPQRRARARRHCEPFQDLRALRATGGDGRFGAGERGERVRVVAELIGVNEPTARVVLV
jgi:hypothetical protein